MNTIAAQFLSFKARLGAVNAHICGVDAVVADAIERAQGTGEPEQHLEQLARRQQYYLGFKRVPELRKPLGTFGVVFQHQVLEGFLQDLEDYLRGKPSYETMDPVQILDPRGKICCDVLFAS